MQGNIADRDDFDEESKDDVGVTRPDFELVESPDNEFLLTGCGWFWTGQLKYQRVDGVVRVVAGYSGGQQDNPTYEEIKDHTEALLVEFDPTQVTYEDLLIEWTKMHKPKKKVSNQYKSVVWYMNEEQEDIARSIVQGWNSQFRTEFLYCTVEAATSFYQAEEYHQDYYLRTGQARFI